jgi:hypothetical protein
MTRSFDVRAVQEERVMNGVESRDVTERATVRLPTRRECAAEMEACGSLPRPARKTLAERFEC